MSSGYRRHRYGEKDGIPVEWIRYLRCSHRMKQVQNLTGRQVLRRIIEFTQGGEVNVIVSGINVGAQSYWNAETAMLQHTKGLLIMTKTAVWFSPQKADFSGSYVKTTSASVWEDRHQTARLSTSLRSPKPMIVVPHYRLAYKKTNISPLSARTHWMTAS